MSLLEKNRADYKRYKEDVKKEGKPFFPYALFHDSVMQLVVVVVIIIQITVCFGEDILFPSFHISSIVEQSARSVHSSTRWQTGTPHQFDQS